MEASVQVPATAEREPRAAHESDAAGDRRGQIVEALTGEWRVIPVLIALAAIWVFFALGDSSFVSPRNLSNLSLQIVVTGVLALGLVLILLVGEIDLSVAASSGVCATVMSTLFVNHGWSAGPAILVAVLLGAAVGGVQAAIVVYGSPSFVVTLGGALMLQGALIALLPNAGQINLADTSIADIAGTYLDAATGWTLAVVAMLGFAVLRWTRHAANRRRKIQTHLVRDVLAPVCLICAVSVAAVAVLNAYQGVPVAVAIFLALLLTFSYITTQTRYGVHLFAAGGNRDAARRAGVPVTKLIVSTFVVAGACAAIGGIIAASRVLGVSVQSGQGSLMLEAIAAAVIGGTSLFGGRGTVWAALLGALVIGSISNGMDLRGMATEVKLVVEGAILIAAITVDAVIARGSLRPRAAAARG
jgi:D-xylose transport system permease protein